MTVTPDGQRAVSASSDHTLKVWELRAGASCAPSPATQVTSMAVAVTPDGQRAVSASDDRTLKVWDLESGRELLTLTGHTSSVNGGDGDAGRTARGLGVVRPHAEGVGLEWRARAAHPHRPLK